MSAGHRDPEYQRNSRLVRRVTNARLTRGELVTCHRCGRAIAHGMRYDIGHRIDLTRGGTNALDNLAPEHRRCNRSAGGRIGAHMTNGTTRRARRLPNW